VQPRLALEGRFVTARPFAQLLETGEVAVVDVKVVYVLRPAEIVLLLASSRSLWLEAIRRGKSLRRARETERRETPYA
jgi:hypothetical protein